MKLRLVGLLLVAGGLLGHAQPVEKVADLNFFSSDGVGIGGYLALDKFTQVGSNLWFTTSRGGTFDAGTVSRFDLATREVVQVASLDNYTGKSPESSLMVIGTNAYFTTLSGGSGNKGTLARINLETGEVEPVYNFPADGSSGASPRGGFTRIGDELWTTTASGGESNRGTVVKFNLTNEVTTLVTNFDGPTLGGQPYEGFVQVGDAWYFTTFTGGNTFATPGLTLGAGTLSRMTFDQTGEPVFTRLIDLPGGHTQFPASAPALVGTNWLYFTTVGPNTAPGSIVRYELSTGSWTNVFSFTTNQAAEFGRQPGYNGLVAWENELYFLTRLGGSDGRGIVAKFNIASNTMIKLADLTGVGEQSLGNASGSYNSGTIVQENDRYHLYFPVSRGGANAPSGASTGLGTIIRVLLPPPAIALSVQADTNGLALSWSGGYPPFTVQTRTDLGTGEWVTLEQNLTSRSAMVPLPAGQGFFRIVGSSE